MPRNPVMTDRRSVRAVCSIPNVFARNRWHYWMAKDERLKQHCQKLGESQGMSVCKGKDYDDTVKYAEELGYNEHFVSKSPLRIEYGDLIMGCLPVAEYTKRRKARAAESAYRAGIKMDEAAHNVNSVGRGVRAVIDAPEELMARKAHAQREGKPTVSMSGLEVPKE